LKQSTKAIPITLIKRSSRLDGFTLLEYLPKERIQALLKSDKLALEWEKPTYVQKFAKQNYQNEVQQITAYLSKYNDNYGAMMCKYRKPKHGWGRVHPEKSLGLTSLGFKVRNTLIRDLYYDFDLKNAQVEIIRNICQQNNIPCEMVVDYCDRRSNVLKDISDRYSVSRRAAKKLVLRLCFFGTFWGWCKDNGLSDATETLWITNFIRELKDIAQRLKKKNPVLYESARKSKEAKRNPNNIVGSFFALYLQEWEVRIVEKVMGWLETSTNVMKHPMKTSRPVAVYEYDGIKLLKENVDKFTGGKKALLQNIIKKTKELTGFDLVWVEKPIEDFHDISHELELVKEDGQEADDLRALIHQMKDRFNDKGVIETIGEIRPNFFAYSKGSWYGWTGSKWLANDTPLKKAIMYDLPKYWDSLLQPYKEKFPEGSSTGVVQQLLYGTPSRFGTDGIVHALKSFVNNHLCSNGHINGCVGIGKALLENDELEFDMNPDLLGFNNGVFDICAECFRPARFNDYVTWSCGWDFRPVLKGMKVMDENGTVQEVKEDLAGDDLEQMNGIQTILKQILPYEDVRHLVLFVLASGLSGRPIEKFFIFNGKGRNGKGLLDEFMKWCLGDYADYVAPVLLCENKRFQSSGAPNPEKAKLHKKRFVVTKEPDKGGLIHNDTMKDLTGGGETQARRCHSNDTRVLLHLTFLMECNEKPGLQDSPTQADAERIVDILFPSFFTSEEDKWDDAKHIYPKNPLLKGDTWKNDHKNVFMNTLVSYLLILKNKAKYNIEQYVPDSVKDRSLAYLQESFSIHTMFTTLFERRSEDQSVRDAYKDSNGRRADTDWSLPAIVKVLRKSREFTNMTKRMQSSKEMKAAAMKGFFETNPFYKDDVYVNSSSKQILLRGWRLKVEEADNVFQSMRTMY
jgi:hypothetical protein